MEYSEHLNYVWNLYRSPENAGWLAGSRWGGKSQGE